MRNSIPEWLGDSAGFEVVGRGAAGIFLVLAHQNFRPNSKVIVPANLCYAGIYPVLYAGLQPIFCDVDPLTGNVTCETFSQALCAGGIVAAIVPHMYGNPVKDLAGIAQSCKKHGVLLIEDCASAMGATSPDYHLGCVGDYTVFSTGYSKTIDLGYGGLVSSQNDNLSWLKESEADFPYLDEEIIGQETFFSRVYRLERNEGPGLELDLGILHSLPHLSRPLFLNRLREEEEKKVLSSLATLTAIVRERRGCASYYDSLLTSSNLKTYPYSEGAVPWRFNILVEPDKRQSLISACLAEGLPVSDWYPNVTPMFGPKVPFPGADWHEARIVNFPIPLERSQVQRICACINQ